MELFERYAIYYTAQGVFASHGAAWLGWDVDQGQSILHPLVKGADLPTLTQAPRKYGFHGTLKPPFRLAKGTDEAGLRTATKSLAQQLRCASAPELDVVALGRFLALVPKGDSTALKGMAAQIVRALDGFRAPMTAEELARRRKGSLSPAQDQNLLRWGYPHVMDQFRFHITLTQRLPRAELAVVQNAAADYFAPVLPRPFEVNALTLVGQRPGGAFTTIERYKIP